MLLLLDRLSGLRIGVNQAVNFGNRVDVGENDLLELWEDDPKIKVIGLYLESVQNGKRFIEIARKVGLKKPVVIWKGGHFGRGTDAARAHSASLAGSYDVFQAACAKSGLIEVNGFEEFSNTLMALASQPPALGNRALVVSNGGGMGVSSLTFANAMDLWFPKHLRYCKRTCFPACQLIFLIATRLILRDQARTSNACMWLNVF